MTDQLHALDAGAAQAAAGAQTLSGGLATLADSSDTLASGASSLAAGADDAAAGADTLAAGIDVARDGHGDPRRRRRPGGRRTSASVAVPSSWRTGWPTARRRSPTTATERTARADALATPVAIDDEDVAPAASLGEGFAPLFIPLALFVGGLITWLLLRPLPTRALATPASGWRVALAGYLPSLVIGAGQVAAPARRGRARAGPEHRAPDRHRRVPAPGRRHVPGGAADAHRGPGLRRGQGRHDRAAHAPDHVGQRHLPGGDHTRVLPGDPPVLPMTYAVGACGPDHRDARHPAVDRGRLPRCVALASLAVTAWKAGRLRTWTVARLHPAPEHLRG